MSSRAALGSVRFGSGRSAGSELVDELLRRQLQALAQVDEPLLGLRDLLVLMVVGDDGNQSIRELAHRRSLQPRLFSR